MQITFPLKIWVFRSCLCNIYIDLPTLGVLPFSSQVQLWGNVRRRASCHHKLLFSSFLHNQSLTVCDSNFPTECKMSVSGISLITTKQLHTKVTGGLQIWCMKPTWISFNYWCSFSLFIHYFASIKDGVVSGKFAFKHISNCTGNNLFMTKGWSFKITLFFSKDSSSLFFVCFDTTEQPKQSSHPTSFLASYTTTCG